MKEGHVAVLFLEAHDLNRVPCGIYDSVAAAEAVLKERNALGHVKQVPLNQLSLFPALWDTKDNMTARADKAAAELAEFVAESEARAGVRDI